MPTTDQLQGLESRKLKMPGLKGLVTYVGCEIGNPNDVPKFTERMADLILKPQFDKQERHIAKTIKAIKTQAIQDFAGGPRQPGEDGDTYSSRVSQVSLDRDKIKKFLEQRMNTVDKNV